LKEKVKTNDMSHEKQTNEYSEANDLTTAMNTMSECLNYFNAKGYAEQFKVVDKKLEAISDKKRYGVDDVEVKNFYRFEGITNPDDMGVLYVIETVDGKKGTLVDAYGVYSDPEVDEFMKGIEIHQKTGKK
jgi:hypothetical protein